MFNGVLIKYVENISLPVVEVGLGLSAMVSNRQDVVGYSCVDLPQEGPILHLSRSSCDVDLPLEPVDRRAVVLRASTLVAVEEGSQLLFFILERVQVVGWDSEVDNLLLLGNGHIVEFDRMEELLELNFIVSGDSDALGIEPTKRSQGANFLCELRSELETHLVDVSDHDVFDDIL